MHQTSVLFICTGNVYRSRFAEALFNHLASQRRLPVHAVSRGLAPHSALEDCLSPYAEVTLRSKGIPLHRTAVTKRLLREEDLENADHLIALSRLEHEPLLRTHFPSWLDRITFWDVERLQHCEPERALDRIERYVEKLVGRLSHNFQPNRTGDHLDPSTTPR